MRWGLARRVFTDATVVCVAAGGGVLRELDDPNLATKLVAAPTWVYVVVQLAAAGTLLERRRHPYTAALLIAVASVFAPTPAAFLVPYAVARYGTHAARSWAVIAALVAGWVVGARVWVIDDPFSGLALIAVSAVLGLYVRARRRLIDELVERAERAERERDLLAERARAEERMRLAGEMHDLVTHRINLMVLQAGALQVSSGEPAVQRASGELRETGVQALEELRDLIGVLRHGPPADGPGNEWRPATAGRAGSGQPQIANGSADAGTLTATEGSAGARASPAADGSTSAGRSLAADGSTSAGRSLAGDGSTSAGRSLAGDGSTGAGRSLAADGSGGAGRLSTTDGPGGAGRLLPADGSKGVRRSLVADGSAGAGRLTAAHGPGEAARLPAADGSGGVRRSLAADGSGDAGRLPMADEPGGAGRLLTPDGFRGAGTSSAADGPAGTGRLLAADGPGGAGGLLPADGLGGAGRPLTATRPAGTGRSPAPDGPPVAELITQSRAVGLAVQLRETGDPEPITPAVRRALYRVVQESLTNVHKHAPGCTATVEIRYTPERVAVEVHNTAPTEPTDAALTAAGGGIGLAGLRRRVEMLGGLLHATSRDDGGFTVTATLPAP